jgi:hypothetical protein
MRHLDTNETKRNEGGEGEAPAEGSEGGGGGDDDLHHIKRSLLGEALGEDDRLGDIKVKSRIRFEDVLQVRQNLKRHTEFGFDATINELK